MELRSLVPFKWGTSGHDGLPLADNPFQHFRRDLDQLFSEFFENNLPRWSGVEHFYVPLDVSEDAKQIKVTAELPGVKEKDIEVTLAGDLLTISAEKTAEKEQKDKQFFMSERSYGSFTRALRLPYSIEENKIDAVFKDGVLTITLPKPPEMQTSTKKIEVKSAT